MLTPGLAGVVIVEIRADPIAVIVAAIAAEVATAVAESSGAAALPAQNKAAASLPQSICSRLKRARVWLRGV